MSLDAVQKHEIARVLELPSRARVLHRELRNALVFASNAKKLWTPPDKIHQLVQLLPELPQQIAQELQERELRDGAFCIVGGEKNQGRDPNIAHLARSDGAWFDFSITVRERGKWLDLLAYDFEIRFPPGMGMPFLRFDLNLPAHRNEERDMRSHSHLGCEDILSPAPLMTPQEILALFIDELRWPEDRKRRDPTDFEVRWFEQTHLLARR
ncbi:MAG TPA: hypothetical protein VN253_06195 [Kofleriaceae bacterium]|nr:hypothetical protein [Kofleriaceae bacterium]